MKTDELKAIYETAADTLAESGYVAEAVEMLGVGYDEVRVKDESNDHKYFTITPRIVKAYARNAHDLALWETVKDVAGENGECFLNTEQLAVLAGISTGQVSSSRKYWLKIKFLAGEVRKDPGYSQAVWHLSIPDLWAKNIEYCKQYPKIADRLAFRRAHKSLHRMKATEKPSQDEIKPSPTETKKNLIKKNNKKSDILDGMLFYGKQGQEQGVDKVENIISELERGLRVNITRTTSNQAVAKRILNDGRSLETWLIWCKADEWRSAHLYIYADLEKVWRDFPQAFGSGDGYNPQGLQVGL